MRANGSLKIVVDGTALTREPGGARTRLVALYGAAVRSTRLDPVVAVRKGMGLESLLAAEGLKTRFVRSFPVKAARLAAAFSPAAGLLAEEEAFAFAAETLPVTSVKGFPTVVTIHDLRFFRRGFSPWGNRFYARFFLRRNLKRAAAIVTVSSAMADEIAAFGLASRKKIHLVPNAAPSIVDARARERIPDRCKDAEPYCLCLARFEPRKNVGRLLDAFRIFAGREGKGCRLIVVGSVSGAEARAVQRRIAADPVLRERVEITGIVDEAEKQALLQHAAFFVQPSLYEGFGMGLLESMVCGTPVACSSIPAHWEVAGRAACFFDPRDPADMAAVMGRLQSSASLRDDLRAAGRRRAARFSWERSAALLEGVFTSLR